MSGVRRHWRSSYRRQIIVGVVLIVAASVVGQFLVSTAINARVKSAERRTLQEQAQIFADEVARVGDLEKRDTAKSVARLLPDTRIVVTWPVGDGGLWYNLTQISRQDAEVTATSGEVEVRLARQYNQTSASSWVIVAVIALVGVIATVVYLLAESVARRLRQQVKGLADTASSFSSGDWSARAVESNDELGRAAAAFNHMADRLAEADASQRRFLADVAHELRTPSPRSTGSPPRLGTGPLPVMRTGRRRSVSSATRRRDSGSSSATCAISRAGTSTRAPMPRWATWTSPIAPRRPSPASPRVPTMRGSPSRPVAAG